MRELEYKNVLYVITKANVSSFVRMEDRRDISPTQVSKINGALLKGEHFNAPLVVNKVGDKYRVIDGNHRIEAINRFFDSSNINAKESIQVTLAEYQNLSSQEEREVYLNWSRQKPQSLDNALQLFKSQIPFLVACENNTCPVKVTITGSESSIKIKVIADALYHLKVCGTSFKSSSMRREEFTLFITRLNFEDYTLFKQFIDVFLEAFGEPKGNMFVKRQFFVPLMHIWYVNREQIPNMVERFQRLNTKQKFKEYIGYMGREVLQTVRGLMVDYMNEGYKKNLVI